MSLIVSSNGFVSRRLLSLIVLIVAVILLPACGLGPRQTRDDDLRLVATTGQFERLLRERSDLLVLDVRPRAAYEAGHMPGAINVPVNGLYEADPQLSTARRIVVYGDGWIGQEEDLLSWVAATKLLTLGYRNVYDYRGGLKLWRADGGRVISGPAPGSIDDLVIVETAE